MPIKINLTFQDQRERLRHALLSIAWPMTQAGASTVFSLLVLATIHAYMVQVFVKVVTLVVSLGMIHGLIVLPIVYASIPFSKKSSSSEQDTKQKIIRRQSSVAPTKIAIQSTPEQPRKVTLAGRQSVPRKDQGRG